VELVAEANRAHVEGMESSTERSPTEARPKKLRSRVTNGKSYFVEADGRGPWARRWTDLLQQIIADIGGPSGLSEGQRQLARRAASISVMCERLEGEMAADVEVDLMVYGMLTDRLGRVLERLGLKRQSRLISDDNVINGRPEVQWSPLRAALQKEHENSKAVDAEVLP
jgi:hypothetical protein